MDDLKNNLKGLLRELTAIPAVAGKEKPMIEFLTERLRPHADNVEVDPLGNVYATKHGREEGPTVMLMCHSDQVGLIVKNILPNGFVLFEPLGGVPKNVLPGKQVRIGKKQIPGIIGLKPGHLQTGPEADKVRPPEKSYIDVGAFSRAEAEAMGVRIGDGVVLTGDFTELANPDMIASRAVDNRIGCAVVLELFWMLSRRDFAGTLIGVSSIREEIGLYGAEIAGDRAEPDYALVVDTIPAGDTPDVDTEFELPVRLNNGPVLPLAAGLGKQFAGIAHPAVVRIIERSAEESGINLQRLTLLGAAWATDAEKLAYAGKGTPTATLAIPRRYSHSPVEVLHLADAARTLQLVQAIVLANKNGVLK